VPRTNQTRINNSKSTNLNSLFEIFAACESSDKEQSVDPLVSHHRVKSESISAYVLKSEDKALTLLYVTTCPG
jgi:hypothetical protein